jgi:hypothetical protein
VLIVTVCGDEYVPATGLKIGVTTWIVYIAELTALSAMPAAYAMAFKVVVVLTVTGPEYTVPLDEVGVLLSVV